MTDPISRQVLEANVGWWEGEGWMGEPVFEAARAILDGEPLKWCVVHLTERSFEPGECFAVHLTGDPDPCRFESQVRIRVTP